MKNRNLLEIKKRKRKISKEERWFKIFQCLSVSSSKQNRSDSCQYRLTDKLILMACQLISTYSMPRVTFNIHVYLYFYVAASKEFFLHTVIISSILN